MEKTIKDEWGSRLSLSVNLNWLPSLVSASLMLSVGTFVLVRYSTNRLRASIYWGVAMISYGFSHLLEFGFSSSLIAEDSFTFFVRQTLVVFMLIFFYAGCTIVFTKSKSLRALTTFLFFVIQEPILYYLDYVIINFDLSSEIHIIFFVIPFSVFFAAFFLADYFTSRRMATLLIAVAWLAFAAILPFYFLWMETPILPEWFVLRTITLIPLAIGYVKLAHKSPQKSRPAEVQETL
jgi:hypothetical protein